MQQIASRPPIIRNADRRKLSQDETIVLDSSAARDVNAQVTHTSSGTSAAQADAARYRRDLPDRCISS